MTTGEIMFYGGILMLILDFLLSVISFLYFRKKKKRVLEEIERDY